MNSSDRRSAMMKIAANIGKQPYAPKAEPAEPDTGLRAALRFAVGRSSSGEMTCYWTVRYPQRRPDQKHPVYSFPIAGMGRDQLINEVITRSATKITAHNRDVIRIAVQQEYLREKYRAALPKYPTLRLLDTGNETGTMLDGAAQEQLQQLLSAEKEQYESSSDRAKALRAAGASSACTVYIDASYVHGTDTMGFGYVIKDVYNRSDRASKVWHLTYGSATGYTSVEGGSTGAELRAIRDALRTPGVLNEDVTNNYRSLFIATDSKWSVIILTALRNGTEPKITKPLAGPVHPDWTGTAAEIIEQLRGITNVTFQWVRGHNGDHLNEMADSLAGVARRNADTNAPDEFRRALKGSIVNRMVKGLEEHGIIAEVEENPASADQNC